LSRRYWFDRGENAVASHRAALRRVGRGQIDQVLKEAKHSIERQSVEFQTGVIAENFESAYAKAFFAAMPTAKQPVLAEREKTREWTDHTFNADYTLRTSRLQKLFAERGGPENGARFAKAPASPANGAQRVRH
jgi:hypothetical protein